MTDVKTTIGWAWLDRAGSENSLTFDIADLSDGTFREARDAAIELGYPGHAGGWWNYLVDDIRRWLGRCAQTPPDKSL